MNTSDSSPKIYQIFSYQITPIHPKGIQLTIDSTVTSYKDLVEKKNQFFAEILSDDKLKLIKPPARIKGFGLEKKHKEYFIFTIQVKRSMLRTNEEKAKEHIPDFPFITIVIDNRKESQKIAIQKNTLAFHNPLQVAEILEYSFSKYLNNYQLDISINGMFSSRKFWDIVKQKEDKIEEVMFELGKPNLTRINKTLTTQMKELLLSTNSKKGTVILKAHEKESIKLSKTDSRLNGIVSADSQGMGDIKLKFRHERQRFSTKNIPTEKIITEGEIHNLTDDKLNKVLDKLLS